MLTDQDYKNLDYHTLLDILADLTAKYTKALVQGAPGHDLNYYRNLINFITDVIRTKKVHENTNLPFTGMLP